MTRPRALMFHELAPQYDALYGTKDYAGEVRRLERIARKYGRSDGMSWLDVACGTGRHLELLRRHHDVTGVDLSPEMLRIARRRLPGVRLVRGDMRTFQLSRQFDVVSCLFSAVGHVRSERELQAAFARFARHTKPGGVVIVEPWIDPKDFRRRHLHLVSRQGADSMVVRLAQAAKRGHRSVIDYHYLVVEPGKRVRYLRETDVGLLVPRARLLTLMRRAGLDPRLDRRGLTTRRSLIIGLKPVPARARIPGGRRTARR